MTRQQWRLNELSRRLDQADRERRERFEKLIKRLTERQQFERSDEEEGESK